MQSTDSLHLRRSMYALLITVAVAIVVGHIVAVNRLYEPNLYRDEGDPNDLRSPWPRTRPQPMPTHGDNDRSRWDTVRALVDDGTYVIGHRDVDSATGQYVDRGIITEDGWKTIDKVLRPDTQDFYSSKPPLLPTLVAGEYWLLKQLFGWSITTDRYPVVRSILVTVNGVLFLVYLIFLARLVEQFGSSDWGRVLVLAAGGFATFVTTFANTLNNHTVAACCVLFALYPALQIWYRGEYRASLFLTAGFFAGFTAVNELPAASFAVGLLLLLLLRAPGRTLLLAVPAALVPVAAALWTNYLALGQLRPAYGEFGGPWYEYAGSYWKIDPTNLKHGIDWAYRSESRAVYAFHVLVGHHGIFSLSPIFLLSVAGMLYGLVKWRRNGEQPPPLNMVALLSLGVSLLVVGFYIGVVNDRNRNYGGWTSGLRWLIWLTPLWLVAMMPVADWLSYRRWGRGLAYLLLGISIFSATYPALNPWRHPWLYDLLQAHGWIQY
ncbi:MAG TPA: hypothetical protein VKU02_24545 [Gemmataceae bacterium]|nr:hypothetical protein [Gemmataceae bacterium]